MTTYKYFLSNFDPKILLRYDKDTVCIMKIGKNRFSIYHKDEIVYHGNVMLWEPYQFSHLRWLMRLISIEKVNFVSIASRLHDDDADYITAVVNGVLDEIEGVK